VGKKQAQNGFKVVVLPAPFSPNKPMTLPWEGKKPTWSNVKAG
jgi:hypothetical protein